MWYADRVHAGNGSEAARSDAGGFAVAPEGDRVLTGIYPSGSYTHLLTNRHRGVLQSAHFSLDGEYEVWFQVVGGGGALGGGGVPREDVAGVGVGEGRGTKWNVGAQPQRMMRKWVRSVCHSSCTRRVGFLKLSDADISTYAGLVIRSCALRSR